MGKTSCTAVVTAAGAGKRFGSETRKQFVQLYGRPILAWTIQIFQQIDWIDEVIVIVPASDLEYVAQEIIDRFRYHKVRRVISGGEERQDSVYRGLQAVSPGCEWVFIHDGVRPFCRRTPIEELFRKARDTGAATLGVPLRDTIKEARNFRVVKTRDRRRFWLIQTPQIFRRSLLESAFQEARNSGFTATDDAGLIEKLGHPVHVVEGDYYNIKITTPEDLAVARRLFLLYFSESGNWIAD